MFSEDVVGLVEDVPSWLNITQTAQTVQNIQTACMLQLVYSTRKDAYRLSHHYILAVICRKHSQIKKHGDGRQQRAVDLSRRLAVRWRRNDGRNILSKGLSRTNRRDSHHYVT